MRGLAVLLCVTAACVTSHGLPLPRMPPAPTLDASFFTPDADPAPKMRVHVIDVGQGAATLVEFSCAAILIDTGGESNRRVDSTALLMTYLRGFFESRPDLNETLALLVLTHPHIDHVRGARVVLGEYKVDHLVTDGLVTSSGGRDQKSALGAAKSRGIASEIINVRTIPAGGLTSPVIDPVACPDGDPDIRVMWGSVDASAVGWHYKDLENFNNQSVVVRISLGESSILITGDLELDDGLLAKHAGTKALDVDVYQVGHHGSYNATSEQLLRALTPKLALIACGPFDRRQAWTAWAYGHPRAVTIDLLERALATAAPRRAAVVGVASGAKQFEGREIKAPIYATGWDSDVIVTMFADGRIAVKTRR
jgi:competence protein ComEC